LRGGGSLLTSSEIIDEERARDIAAATVGHTNLIKIQSGRNNWVYQTNDLVVSIPRTQRVNSYAIRYAAARHLERHAVPVPRVVKYSQVEGIDVLVAERIRAFPSYGENRHRNAGVILRQIHRAPSYGWGRLNAGLVGTSPSWVDFIDDYFNTSLSRVNAHPDLDKLSHVLREQYSRLLPLIHIPTSPSFLHADFHPGNMLYDGDTIAAVLDLDIVSSGPKEWDIGHYCFTCKDDPQHARAALLEGYGDASDQISELFYAMCIWTRKVGSQYRDRPDAFTESSDTLVTILERLDDVA